MVFSLPDKRSSSLARHSMTNNCWLPLLSTMCACWNCCGTSGWRHELVQSGEERCGSHMSIRWVKWVWVVGRAVRMGLCPLFRHYWSDDLVFPSWEQLSPGDWWSRVRSRCRLCFRGTATLWVDTNMMLPTTLGAFCIAAAITSHVTLTKAFEAASWILKEMLPCLRLHNHLAKVWVIQYTWWQYKQDGPFPLPIKRVALAGISLVDLFLETGECNTVVLSQAWVSSASTFMIVPSLQSSSLISGSLEAVTSVGAYSSGMRSTICHASPGSLLGI